MARNTRDNRLTLRFGAGDQVLLQWLNQSPIPKSKLVRWGLYLLREQNGYPMPEDVAEHMGMLTPRVPAMGATDRSVHEATRSLSTTESTSVKSAVLEPENAVALRTDTVQQLEMPQDERTGWAVDASEADNFSTLLENMEDIELEVAADAPLPHEPQDTQRIYARLQHLFGSTE